MTSQQTAQHDRSSILPPPDLQSRFVTSKFFFDSVFFNPKKQTYDVNRFLEMSDSQKDRLNREMISDAFSNDDTEDRVLHIANCWSDMAQYFAKLAAKDGLTGLFNKIAFQDAVLDTFRQLEKRRFLPKDNRGTAVINKSAAMIDIDLDRFKPFNDVFGHTIGDIALVTTANLLKDFTRASDYSGRIGGDEFSLLLVDVHEEEARAIHDRLVADSKRLSITLPYTKVIMLSDEALEKLSKAPQPIWTTNDLTEEEYAILGLNVEKRHDSLVVSVDASFGMAMFEDGMSLDDIDAAADKAMFEYKNANRPNFPYYSR